ncbi:MAG: hypothetical protein LKE30_07105 [Bacteroidales bacterium]|jgi:zinc transporter ZupT|nr:hypothetical protein [Bacteroidales bacterium]
MIILSYFLLFVTAIISGYFVILFRKNERIIKGIEVFGGAFLLAVCFLDLLPNIYLTINPNIDANKAIIIGIFVLAGFFLQLILEFMPQNKSKKSSALLLLIGVSIHAFFEGFALVINNKLNTLLFFGVIIHNIPISIILINSFLSLKISKSKSFILLSLFAIMGILGSIINNIIPIFSQYSEYILAFVVGILLHVGVSILFDGKEDKKYNFLRLIIVISAFIIVALMPK